MFNIILLGLVSFFSDISSEMVYPLIPLYLVSAFGATPALVGIIEGIAESAASLLKVFGGYITDKYHNKKPVAFIGYATGLIYKVALIIASSWAGILAARVIDRVGKGIRTAPRDSLVAESADKSNMGKAFGVHKTLDMLGSAIGIAAAYFLLRIFTDASDYKKLFAVSALPAVVGLIILLFVREKKVKAEKSERIRFWKNIKLIDADLRLYLVVTFIFTLGNSSNTFLLLRAKNVGFDDSNVVLLYFIYNITAALFSIPFGRLSDRIGRKKLLVASYFIFSIVYLGFAFAPSSGIIIAVFVIYGIYTAAVTGAERAMIAEISPPHLRGTMLGLHSTVVGIALLPASIIAGFLWNTAGASAPFVYGSSLSAVAAIMLLILLGKKKKCNT